MEDLDRIIKVEINETMKKSVFAMSAALAAALVLAAGAVAQDGPEAGAPDGAPVVLLSHQPRFAHDFAKYPISLQLSGHTHGGMIAGLPVLLVKIANLGFVSGKYQVGGMTLYVSNGAGLWNGFMFRLGVPSEITEIILRTPQAVTK